jgi:hypothetical protein
MGIATYGRSFSLGYPPQCAFGAPVNDAGQAGPYTQEEGFLGYNEVHHTNYVSLSQKITIQSQEVTKPVKGLEEMRQQEL